MTHQVFSFLPSVHTRKCCFTYSGFNAPPMQTFFSPVACRRGNSLNFWMFFFGLIIPPTLFFGGGVLFFFSFFSRVSLISPLLPHSFTYLNYPLVIPRIHSRSLLTLSNHPTAPSPTSIVRYIHLGFVFWYREISISCAGIGSFTPLHAASPLFQKYGNPQRQHSLLPLQPIYFCIVSCKFLRVVVVIS
jgi:hypothetical protein